MSLFLLLSNFFPGQKLPNQFIVVFRTHNREENCVMFSFWSPRERYFLFGRDCGGGMFSLYTAEVSTRGKKITTLLENFLLLFFPHKETVLSFRFPHFGKFFLQDPIFIFSFFILFFFLNALFPRLIRRILSHAARDGLEVGFFRFVYIWNKDNQNIFFFFWYDDINITFTIFSAFLLMFIPIFFISFNKYFMEPRSPV